MAPPSDISQFVTTGLRPNALLPKWSQISPCWYFNLSTSGCMYLVTWLKLGDKPNASASPRFSCPPIWLKSPHLFTRQFRWYTAPTPRLIILNINACSPQSMKSRFSMSCAVAGISTSTLHQRGPFTQRIPVPGHECTISFAPNSQYTPGYAPAKDYANHSNCVLYAG